MAEVFCVVAFIAGFGVYIVASDAEAKAVRRFHEEVMDFAKRRWRQAEINAEKWEDDGR